MVTVPIVSLIDILAILLIFVILTWRPREVKVYADITPPSSGALAARAAEERRVELAITSDMRFWLAGREVAADGFAAALAALKADDPGVKLELKTDEDAPLKALVFAWDALTRAGFELKDIPSRLLMEKSATTAPPPATP